MTFEQFYLGCLAHASYLIGSEGIAAVVDPRRDVDIYLETAQGQGLRIAHIIETHLHADFVSGHRELAERTGATVYVGEGSGAAFPHRAVHDGDTVEFGECRLRFLQTPGHTIESISVVVTDLERGADPWAVLTGDTLFIGDVGRPDLSDSYTPAQLAGLLFDSLNEKLLALSDDVLVYPAHGAGSLCGRNIGADRNSTIGRERRFNYALQPKNRDAFVELVTHDLPARPEYFRRDVEANRRGAVPMESLAPVAALPAPEVLRRQREGAAVLDARPAPQFCSGHVPGSVQIGLGGQFAAWAATVIGLDRDIVLVTEDGKTAEEARMRLARVGIERVAGALDEGIAGWARAGLPLAMTEQIPVHELSGRLGEFSVLDVRRAAEWNDGHIEGALLRPLDALPAELASLDRSKTVAVHCKSGYRSLIACSLLEAGGFSPLNVPGGFDAWVAAGLPAVRA